MATSAKSAKRWRSGFRPESSPGYEKSGREKFNHKVQFRVDYKDFEKSFEQIDKELSSQGQIMKSFYRSIKTPRTGTGGKTFFMELTPAATSSMSGVRNPGSTISAPGHGYRMSIALQPILSTLGEQAKNVMRKYVNRIDTGLMKREVRFQVRKRNGYSTLEVGWVRNANWRKYFGFQENGFKHWVSGRRIPGMRSVMRTGLEFAPKFQKQITVFLRKYMKAK